MKFPRFFKFPRRGFLIALRWLFLAAIVLALIAPDFRCPPWIFESLGIIRWDYLILWLWLYLLIVQIQLELQNLNNSLTKIEASLQEIISGAQGKEKS